MKLLLLAAGLLTMGSANATMIDITPCSGAVSCTVTDTPPAVVSANPNDGVLLGWDEVQNYTLTTDLYVDRVFDPAASFVEVSGSGYIIKAGTIVSSHYLQWDPGNGSSGTVEATINTDSQIFGFITSDQALFDSDAYLGLSSVDYNDFTLRGLESGDYIAFNGNSVDIRWSASSPGDWTRMITAYSPAGVSEVPVPAAALLFGPALLGFIGLRRKSRV